MEESKQIDSKKDQAAKNRMPLISFGNTGLTVSRVGFGGMELAGLPRAPDLSVSQATNLVHAAMDLGINYFDTSIDYGNSEEVLGIALRKRRDRVVIASKCGCLAEEHAQDERSHVYTPSNISAGIRQSLKRLGTDHIDVMQFHGNPTMERLEQEGGLQTLLELQKKGVIGHIGLSSRKPYVSEFLDMDMISVFQLPYSALQRQHEDIADIVSRSGRAVVARGVTARGSVANVWSSVPIGMSEGQAQIIWDKAGIDELISPMSRIEFMIRFAVTNPAVNVLLTGTSNVSHLEENVSAAGKGPLDQDLYQAVVARLTEAGSMAEEVEYRRGGPLAR